MKINIKVDKNDGDFIYIKSKLDSNDIHDLMIMVKALKDFKPTKKRHQTNFANGGRYGFTMWRGDLGGKNPYYYYVKSGKVSESVFKTFKKYVKNRTFHTVKKIILNNKIVFNS